MGVDVESSRVDQGKALDGSYCPSESLDCLGMKADNTFQSLFQF